MQRPTIFLECHYIKDFIRNNCLFMIGCCLLFDILKRTNNYTGCSVFRWSRSMSSCLHISLKRFGSSQGSVWDIQIIVPKPLLCCASGLLSFWRMNLMPSLRSLVLWTRFPLRLYLYFALFSFPHVIRSYFWAIASCLDKYRAG